MMIGGKQCTICWYVYDTKISHHKPKIVTELISKIEERLEVKAQLRWYVRRIYG